MTNAELADMARAASAWNALMTSVEAIHAASTEDGATGDEKLNAYIDAWAKQRDTAAKLRTALSNLLEHYVDLIRSGDAGNWDPEKEDVVAAARLALKGTGDAH